MTTQERYRPRGEKKALEVLLLGEMFDAHEALVRETEDFREGTRAFLEKRQPQFRGR